MRWFYAPLTQFYAKAALNASQMNSAFVDIVWEPISMNGFVWAGVGPQPKMKFTTKRMLRMMRVALSCLHWLVQPLMMTKLRMPRQIPSAML